MWRPVTFKKVSTDKDSYGQPVGTTTDVVRTGADVRALSDSEVTKRGLEFSQEVVLFKCRYTPSLGLIMNDDLIEFQDMDFSIMSIDHRGYFNGEIWFTARRIK